MLFDEVKNVIADALRVPADTLDADSSVGDFPEWNSLGHMLIVNAIEEHFGITLDSERIMELESVADFAEAVDAQCGGNAGK